jgi:hypothetical protein
MFSQFTHLDEQEHVEGLKDLDGRLVDGDHDGAPVAGQVAHRRHHDGSGACVQTTGGLIL